MPRQSDSSRHQWLWSIHLYSWKSTRKSCSHNCPSYCRLVWNSFARSVVSQFALWVRVRWLGGEVNNNNNNNPLSFNYIQRNETRSLYKRHTAAYRLCIVVVVVVEMKQKTNTREEYSLWKLILNQPTRRSLQTSSVKISRRLWRFDQSKRFDLKKQTIYADSFF